MKKSKLFIVGFLGLLLALGIFLISCTFERCDGDCIWWGDKADDGEHKEKICNAYGDGGACFNGCYAWNHGYKDGAVLVFLPVKCGGADCEK